MVLESESTGRVTALDMFSVVWQGQSANVPKVVPFIILDFKLMQKMLKILNKKLRQKNETMELQVMSSTFFAIVVKTTPQNVISEGRTVRALYC